MSDNKGSDTDYIHKIVDSNFDKFVNKLTGMLNEQGNDEDLLGEKLKAKQQQPAIMQYGTFEQDSDVGVTYNILQQAEAI